MAEGRPGRERVKLVTLAACWSAAVTADQQRRLLGLPTPKPDLPNGSSPAPQRPAPLATELTVCVLIGYQNIPLTAHDLFAPPGTRVRDSQPG